MSDSFNFDEIRPFHDEEIASVVAGLMENPAFMNLAFSLFPGEEDALKETLNSIDKAFDFQGKIVYPLMQRMLQEKSDGLTSSGFDALDPKGAYLFISNHRDIILDSALLNFLLFEKGFNTTEIAIGDNLLIEPWIEHLVRLNKSFIVHRKIQGRQQLAYSQRLSSYIRHRITEEESSSVWIAQREGRTKDGNDLTQPSLLKMLNISGEGSVIENFRDLRIVPVSISYEYDPCGVHKLWELEPESALISPEEDRAVDLNNMVTGFQGRKGRIHFAAGAVLDASLENLAQQGNRNEQIKALSEQIDHSIHQSYRLFPAHYYAYDLAHGGAEMAAHYSEQDQALFESYLEEQQSIFPHPVPDLRAKLIRMYSWPVENQIGNKS